MRCIVADSGPLIALSGVDLLHVPAAVYGSVLITQTVLRECAAKNWRGEGGRIDLALAEGKLISHPDPEPLDVLRNTNLDPGELTALALALGVNATILIDEYQGRRVARQLGIPIIGLCGLLLIAKQKAVVSAVLPLLHEMKSNGYFLSEALIAQVGGLAHE